MSVVRRERRTRLLLGPILVLLAMPAQAEIGASLTLASQERFRGYSVSNGYPAATLSLSYDDAAGPYVEGSLMLAGQCRLRGTPEEWSHARRRDRPRRIFGLSYLRSAGCLHRALCRDNHPLSLGPPALFAVLFPARGFDLLRRYRRHRSLIPVDPADRALWPAVPARRRARAGWDRDPRLATGRLDRLGSPQPRAGAGQRLQQAQLLRRRETWRHRADRIGQHRFLESMVQADPYRARP
jgi:hypothetical protein